MDAIGIARTGLQASMVRLTASASNIANVHSTGPVPVASSGVDAAAGQASGSAYQPVQAQLSSIAGGGVQASLMPQDPAYVLRYDPSSSQADARGMVAAPAVDEASELVDTLSARQDFLASLTVIRTTAELEKHTVERWG